MRTPTTNTKKKLPTLLASLVVFLSIANIIASASFSSWGEKLRELESRSRDLKHENQLLEQTLVTSRSLTKLSENSEKLGFVERPQIVTLTQDEAVARGL